MCNEIKSMQPAGQHARHSIVSARVPFETIENSILSPAKKKIYVLLACGIRLASRGVGLDGVVKHVAHHHGGRFSK